MITLTNVCKRYYTGSSPKVVLDNVSVTFPTGRSVGILGLNGAGKSTLIRIIGDAEPTDSGSILRQGNISWPLGYAGGFQNNLTGRDNARFVARIYGESPERIERFTEQFAELGSYFDLPLRTYSAGMRGRFAFSVSLACDFDIYLVDEALETGDARYKEKFRLAFEERRADSSLILVSHNEQTVRRNCDMAAILNEGKITMYDDLKEAFEYYQYLQTRAVR